MESRYKMSDLEKEFPGSKGALVLDEVFNSCILRFEDGVFIYKAECVINVLKDEFKQSIENGLMDFYGDCDLDESAGAYAVEHFEYNIEASKGDRYPKYEYSEVEK